MKNKITIQAHIWHGNYNEKIQASGETVADCISQLAKANGYIGEPDRNDYSIKLVAELETTGKGALGWVEYELIKTEAGLDQFTRGYIECALWSSNDESTPSGGEPMDKNYSIADIAPGTLAEMVSDCAKFQADQSELLARVSYPKNDSTDLAHAGHDFWLTRNGHGSGFWDGDLEETLGAALTQASKAYKQTDLYIGDDGKIYA